MLLSHFSRVRLCATPQTAAHQAPRPWDSPGKNTGVGCHFLLQCMKVKSESEVAQSCPTLSNPMDCSLPGSSIHGIFQARVLEWGAIAFSKLHIYFKLKKKTKTKHNQGSWGIFHRILAVGFWYLPHPILRECWAIPSYDLYEKMSLVAHSVKNLHAMQKDLGQTPGSGRSPVGGHGNPLQYSYLENPMDRGAWQATVPGVTRVGHNLATKTPPRYNCMYQSHNALYNYLDNTNVSENI